MSTHNAEPSKVFGVEINRFNRQTLVLQTDEITDDKMFIISADRKIFIIFSYTQFVNLFT